MLVKRSATIDITIHNFIIDGVCYGDQTLHFVQDAIFFFPRMAKESPIPTLPLYLWLGLPW